MDGNPRCSKGDVTARGGRSVTSKEDILDSDAPADTNRKSAKRRKNIASGWLRRVAPHLPSVSDP